MWYAILKRIESVGLIERVRLEGRKRVSQGAIWEKNITGRDG